MQAKKRTQQFVAAFVISGIVIAAMCGFVLVDLSTDRYMAGEVGALFQITSLNAEGVRFSLLGESYALETTSLAGWREQIWAYRAWLPASSRIAGGAVAQGYLALRDYQEEHAEPEAPW